MRLSLKICLLLLLPSTVTDTHSYEPVYETVKSQISICLSRRTSVLVLVLDLDLLFEYPFLYH